MPKARNEHDALLADVPVTEFIKCMQLLGLKLGPLLVVVQVGIREVAADQCVFMARAGEPDVVGMYVAVALGIDELDACNVFQGQVEVPVVGFSSMVTYLPSTSGSLMPLELFSLDTLLPPFTHVFFWSLVSSRSSSIVISTGGLLVFVLGPIGPFALTPLATGERTSGRKINGFLSFGCFLAGL